MKLLIMILHFLLITPVFSQIDNWLIGYYGGTKTPIGLSFFTISGNFGLSFTAAMSNDFLSTVGKTLNYDFEINNGQINAPYYYSFILLKKEYKRYQFEIGPNLKLFSNADIFSCHLSSGLGIGQIFYIYDYSEYINNVYNDKVTILDNDKSKELAFSWCTGLLIHYRRFAFYFGASSILGTYNEQQLNFGINVLLDY